MNRGYWKHFRKPDYSALSAEVARLRRRIHAVRDFDQVPGPELERYIEAMGDRDLAEFREVWG